MKIIVVDDEMSALHVFLNDIIHDNMTEYRFFQDNEECILNYVKNNWVHAAFLDIRMPNLDGVALARSLLEINPSMQIVFITGLNVTMADLPEEVRAHTMGFLYKPYDEKTLGVYLARIENKSYTMTVKMFGSFECFIGDNTLQFSSVKSKELFALLMLYAGKNLTMNDAISQLWPEHNYEKAKKLYRDAVWRLRKTLDENAFPCVIFGRAQLTLRTQNIQCDYWDFLRNVNGDYRGELLKNYDWSMEYQTELDAIRKSRAE
jgi:two-component SAPR family response regulator